MGFSSEGTDRRVLESLRARPLTIAELIEELGVTATAVRQRLERLLAMGLVCRGEERVGRGRPVHRYSLTSAGQRALGNNLADLAVALWSEVQSLPDPELRLRIMQGVAARLAATWKHELRSEGVEDRMQELARSLRDQRMSVEVESAEGTRLPILKFHGCPYPDLSEINHDICEVEGAMLSALLGQPLSLTSCRCDSASGVCTYEVAAVAK